ncbi:MAG TPA: phosphatase PAP2 family protein [Candidatus Limnocylindria bacterium]|nr:phosphatase PAP2 family protein [Candidatus Limnocylindria bacterium]
MTEVLEWLLRFDRELYVAITNSRGDILGLIALSLSAFNFNGFGWYVIAYLAWRARRGRRGIAAALTVLLGMGTAWWTAELVKLAVRRQRPFNTISDAPAVLQFEPTSWSFPSGDSALAMGAAVALGGVYPGVRGLAILVAAAVAASRVVVGVHHPLDALAGSLIGVAGGLLAPHLVARLRRLARWRGYVVAHTHWDREWYERFEGYRARLVPMVTRLLALLERDPAFRSFTFDGQTIAIEDHLAKRPEDRPRVEALVRADRLLVGPWYVLADLLLVSGESIVRNLQEGLRVSGELGRAMRVAYVADPFGHPAQMPQVLRGFGYTSYVFARGVGREGDALGSEFWWESPSGDRVLACHQIEHYSGALQLVAEGGRAVEDVRRRVRRTLPGIFRRLSRHASGDALLFMVGDDHTEAFERLPEAVSAARAVLPRVDLRIASLEEFVDAVGAPGGVISGEMVNGYYRPILRGVNSTRVWIKQENARCERLLLERCEPLDAATGGTAREELRSLWRTLLENHPHDSICGCSIDDVHDVDMAPRFARVRRDGEALYRRLLASLAGAGGTPLLFDPLPWAREAVVDDDGTPTLVRTAGLGVAPLVRLDGRSPAATDDGVLENEHLRVEVALDGSFVVADRATGVRSGVQNALVDDGDRGDEYTYSYAGPTIRAAGLAGRRTAQVRGDRATVTVELVLRLPAGLRADRFARVRELVDVPVSCLVSLDAGARRVDVTVRVRNAARDHRLRAFCATGTRTLDHVAGAAFALVPRANRIPRPRRWVEPPTETRCAHDVVAVVGATRGLAVGLDGVREYAVLDDGRTIAVTLFRAVGWLSRGDLPERRGHAGPALETPSAQCPGDLELRYCVVPIGPDHDLVRARREVRGSLSPPLAARGAQAVAPLLALDRASPIELSSLRSAPGGALVLRLVNPTREEATTTVTFSRPVAASRPADLREGEPALGNTALEVIRTAAPLETDGAMVTARLAPYEIGTWLVTLSG